MQNAFTIDSGNGEIKVARDIDRENINRFILGVQAKDGEHLFVHACLTIKLKVEVTNLTIEWTVVYIKMLKSDLLENVNKKKIVQGRIKDKIVHNPQSVSPWFVREVPITIPRISSNPLFNFFPFRVFSFKKP